MSWRRQPSDADVARRAQRGDALTWQHRRQPWPNRCQIDTAHSPCFPLSFQPSIATCPEGQSDTRCVLPALGSTAAAGLQWSFTQGCTTKHPGGAAWLVPLPPRNAHQLQRGSPIAFNFPVSCLSLCGLLPIAGRTRPASGSRPVILLLPFPRSFARPTTQTHHTLWNPFDGTAIQCTAPITHLPAMQRAQPPTLPAHLSHCFMSPPPHPSPCGFAPLYTPPVVSSFSLRLALKGPLAVSSSGPPSIPASFLCLLTDPSQSAFHESRSIWLSLAAKHPWRAPAILPPSPPAAEDQMTPAPNEPK